MEFCFPPEFFHKYLRALVWIFYVSLPTLFRESVLTFRFFLEAQAISVLSFFFSLFRANVVDSKLVCVLHSELITGREVVFYEEELSSSFLRAVNSRNPANPGET